ncbi:hypothetical protein ASE75_12855 [Sphingomonas sp. Leaf17]|uniref:AbrB/MazE/SpoVT family DNA-binding domain-containing protein n=1 Tax=Sphingomonas sp. Leaf17 TaxID=1735683 RepID=UPI0006FED252|nr:hypothetical protein [Sphingomonas sp. Leaf17]KQM63344.1 hypothetical protein ASE75_12855 [Sphingomonas sp. Leaf17]
MQTSFRKMGNSTGMLVPRAVLTAMGLKTGAALDLTIEDGRLIATPMTVTVRAGWAEAAAAIGVDDAPEWRTFGTEDDADSAW